MNKTWNIEVTGYHLNGDKSDVVLRVKGENRNEAIQCAYNFLVRQYDGDGIVHESSLKEIESE